MKILIHTQEGAEIMETKEIIFCKADDRYSEIFSFDKKLKVTKLHSNFRISELEKLLPAEDFMLIHRSKILNFEHFKKYNSKTNVITLSSGRTISISASKKKEFKHRLLKYIEKVNSQQN